MTKLQMSELHKLSVKDKIMVVQVLWDDIAKDHFVDGLPIEHKKILKERLLKIDSGEAQFKSWEEVQKKYSQL